MDDDRKIVRGCHLHLADKDGRLFFHGGRGLFVQACFSYGHTGGQGEESFQFGKGSFLLFGDLARVYDGAVKVVP